ncbi:DUF2905 domain-containing protein [Azotosporobacter soli]|uniref:DUF2905 domain-containing protein n=1 Tax=Azotosporobacter soli TaxID=3055040 RepID=UPI0031FE8667
MFESPGKTLIVIGFVCLILGLLLQFGGKWIPFGRLPGDILLQRESGSFYFPLTSCIIASVILSIILFFINRR